jgi:hypothetical protein
MIYQTTMAWMMMTMKLLVLCVEGSVVAQVD